MAKKTDQKTLDLIKEVARQKEEISKAEKPNWLTNCTFQGDDKSQITNIHVESNLKNLINIVAFLQQKETAYNVAAKTLSVEAPAFEWGGFKVSDWVEDVKTRLNKVQIATKRKKLEALETRLNSIISPELRAELELEAISAELS